MEIQDNIIILPNGTVAKRAEYKEQSLQEYRDNPLIEALPEILTRNQVAGAISVYPIFDKEERNLTQEIRQHCIQRLFQYFQPFPHHFELQESFSAVIRQGYLARNPFRPEYAVSLRNGYEMIKDNNMNLDGNVLRTTSAGFTIIGVSGIGKTTSIDRILSLYPQIIVHSKYKDMPLSLYQLSWLKLDCPFDGSLKGLCIDFFIKIDSLLGTSYYKKFGNSRNSTNAMMPQMAQIAQAHCIGALVIDEIQHINLAKSGGSDEMLNFFVTLVNTIGVPVILIGTMKALYVLQKEFRQARRESGQGDMIIDRMHKNMEWDLFIEALLQYQWTKKEIANFDDISNALYYESQGIIDIAVKLYARAQITAISLGKEIVTPNLIREVAETNFKLVKPMLDALKSGNPKEIMKYSDIYTANVKDSTKAKDKLEEAAIAHLRELDIDSHIARMLVEQVLRAEPGLKINQIVLKAIALMKEEQNSEIKKVASKSKTKQRKKSNPVKEDNDLRTIFENAKNSETSVCEGLKRHGYIKPPLEDILELG